MQTGLAAMRLSDALCARLCHDLSTPVGTLIGTLELANEDPDSAAEALMLAAEAAAGLGARLRLARAAWGGDCGALSPGQIAGLAGGLPPRVAVRLDRLDAASYPGPLARLLINLLLLGAEALPFGGTAELASRGRDILLTIDGRNAKWPDGLAEALAGGVVAGNPRTVQAPLTALLAQAAGMRLELLAPADGAPAPLLLAAA